MPRYSRRDPPFRWRIGQIVYVPFHNQHGEVIERERTNDGESQICPPSTLSGEHASDPPLAAGVEARFSTSQSGKRPSLWHETNI